MYIYIYIYIYIYENFLIISLNQLIVVANLNKVELLKLNFRQSYYVMLIIASHVIWHVILGSRHFMREKKAKHFFFSYFNIVVYAVFK